MKKVYMYLTLLLCGAIIAIVGKLLLTDPEINLLLRARHQLAVGDLVEYQRVPIGEIVAVGFDHRQVYGRQYKVAVAKIDRAYFYLLYREMDYVLRRSNSSIGRWRIDIVGKNNTARTPVLPGDRLFVKRPGEKMLDDTEEALEKMWNESKPLRELVGAGLRRGIGEIQSIINRRRADSTSTVPERRKRQQDTPPAEGGVKDSSDPSTEASG